MLDEQTLVALDAGPYQRVLAGLGPGSTCKRPQGYIPCFDRPDTPGFRAMVAAQVHRSRAWAKERPA